MNVQTTLTSLPFSIIYDFAEIPKVGMAMSDSNRALYSGGKYIGLVTELVFDGDDQWVRYIAKDDLDDLGFPNGYLDSLKGREIQ